MTDIEIIAKVAEYTGLSFNKLAKEIGLTSPQTFYDIKAGKHGISKELAEKIHARYLNINEAWLLTGNGEMLKSEAQYVDYEEVGHKKEVEVSLLTKSDTVEVDIDSLMREWHTLPENFAKIIGEDVAYVRACKGLLFPRHIIALQKHYGMEVVDKYAKYTGGIKAEVVEAIPIISDAVTVDPETNIKEYVEENSSELETIDPTKILLDGNVSLAEKIKRTSMLPTFQPDDVVFIRFLEDKQKIVDGETYYFDCKNRPTMVRLVKFEGEDKLRLIAKNPQYADIIIDRDDVTNVGEVVAMFRMTFGDQYSELEKLRRESNKEREKKDAQLDKMLEMMQAQGEQQSKLIDYLTKEK